MCLPASDRGAGVRSCRAFSRGAVSPFSTSSSPSLVFHLDLLYCHPVFVHPRRSLSLINESVSATTTWLWIPVPMLRNNIGKNRLGFYDSHSVVQPAAALEDKNLKKSLEPIS